MCSIQQHISKLEKCFESCSSQIHRNCNNNFLFKKAIDPLKKGCTHARSPQPVIYPLPKLTNIVPLKTKSKKKQCISGVWYMVKGRLTSLWSTLYSLVQYGCLSLVYKSEMDDPYCAASTNCFPRYCDFQNGYVRTNYVSANYR